MSTFAESIAKYAGQDPLDPDTFLQEMWSYLSPSQQEMFSAMLAQPSNVRRDVSVQGGQGNLSPFGNDGVEDPYASSRGSGVGTELQRGLDGKTYRTTAGAGQYGGGNANLTFRTLPDGTIISIDNATGKEVGRRSPTAPAGAGKMTNFTPAGTTASGALSGQAPGTSSSGWTNKISDNLTIRDVAGATPGTARFESVQTGNEVQVGSGGGYSEVGQPTSGGSQAFTGSGGTFNIDSTAANYQGPSGTRIKLRDGSWLDLL